MATTQIVLSLVKLFLMIIPGYILCKAKVIDEHQSKGLSSLVINLTWPCMIVISLQRAFSKELCINMGILAVCMSGAIVIAFLLAKGLTKVLKMDNVKTYLVTFMLMFGNTGFMGIPVCTALYGSEGTFYAALIDCVQDVFIFTAGLVLIEKSTGKHIGMNIKNFYTPGFISVIIGLGLFVAGITLPSVIAVPMDTIGSATAPIAMLIVGYQLGNINFREFFGDWSLYSMTFCRLIIMPVIFLAIVWVIFPEMSILTKVLVVEMATPVAACTAMYSQQYDGDVKFATKGVMFSTVLSLITLSVFAVIVEMI